MSETTHTPGPWAIMPEEVDRPYIRVRGTMLGGRYKIANVITPIYDGIHEREAIETRANARLIAAAPDLLATLKELIDLEGPLPGNVAWFNKAVAAVARAEGRS